DIGDADYGTMRKLIALMGDTEEDICGGKSSQARQKTVLGGENSPPKLYIHLLALLGARHSQDHAP
ncbi:MAG: hypothetical protein H8E35_03810, partial [Ardenticatenia bacterium]|nr:hypothetical protein [Ardenticatenia bacterium]